MYNKEGLYCCDIITFNTIALKGAIKDIGRALGMSLKETQDISNAVYEDEKKQQCIDESYIEKYPELFHYANLVKGVIVSVGNHPSALVVSPHEVNPAFATMTTSKNKNPISQINMKEIDGLNYVKLDVLGLDSIGLINKTCELANIPRLDPDNMNFSDEDVWRSISDDTTLIFQWESNSASAYIKQLFNKKTINKIKDINPNFSYLDLLSIGNGAIRPAGASYRKQLANGEFRDNGHYALNNFLSPTLGYLVYQEQIIEFLHSFCGFTMGEADIVRRGFAKKTGTEEFIPRIKAGFFKTMKDTYNVELEESEKLITSFIKVIEDASSYLFSLNHSAPYSMIGYATAYLRYYYPMEFIAAALNIWSSDIEKTANVMALAQSKGVTISSPKFRHSKSDYMFDKEAKVIYKGLSSIKFVSEKSAEALYSLKDNNYKSFTDLLLDLSGTIVDSRQLDILIKLDFFSEFGNAKELLTAVDLFTFFKNGEAKTIKYDKLNAFDYMRDIVERNSELTESGLTYRNLNMPKILSECNEYITKSNIKDFDIKQKVEWQQEYLGYVSLQSGREVDRYRLAVLDVIPLKTKDKSKVYTTVLKCMSLGTGKTNELKIWQNVFDKKPVNKYDILLTSPSDYEQETYNGVKSWRLKKYTIFKEEYIADLI